MRRTREKRGIPKIAMMHGVTCFIDLIRRTWKARDRRSSDSTQRWYKLSTKDETQTTDETTNAIHQDMRDGTINRQPRDRRASRYRETGGPQHCRLRPPFRLSHVILREGRRSRDWERDQEIILRNDAVLADNVLPDSQTSAVSGFVDFGGRCARFNHLDFMTQYR